MTRASLEQTLPTDLHSQDRLKPIGAEELIQYYIAKLALEEARANPDRFSGRSASTTDSLEQHGSSRFAHDQKLTLCLEAYIHWFNALTRFVTIETLKHTKKRSRIAIINYFIDAAHECFRLGNFNSMFAILGKDTLPVLVGEECSSLLVDFFLGGLNMQPVKRLKRTVGVSPARESIVMHCQVSSSGKRFG